MKLKSTLLSLAVAVAFTMPIDAAQYTVPEGQPPVPGADASIPDTAYQNYRYGEALNANASAIILARKHIYEMLDNRRFMRRYIHRFIMCFLPSFCFFDTSFILLYLFI